MAIFDDTLVVAAPLEDGASPGVNGDGSNDAMTDSGAAYVFVREGTAWKQQAYLKASNPGGPDKLTLQGDQFGGGESMHGRAVAIWGDTIAVGAAGEDSRATSINGDQGDVDRGVNSAAVYVFVRTGGAWAQQAYLKTSHHSTNFGASVALHRDTIVAGAWQDDAGGVTADNKAGGPAAERSGAAWLFQRLDGVWSLRRFLKAADVEHDAFFGSAVAMDEQTIAVTAPGQGAVYVFH